MIITVILIFYLRIKNFYFKNKEKVVHLLSLTRNYSYLPEKLKIQDNIIDDVLKKDNDMFSHLPNIILDNKEKVMELINKHKNIKESNIPYVYRNDYDLAKILIERDGSNFKSFNFSQNKELIYLASKTYFHIKHIPPTDEYRELIRDIVLKANNENSTNFELHYRSGKEKIEIIKNLIPHLLSNSTFRIYSRTIIL